MDSSSIRSRLIEARTARGLGKSTAARRSNIHRCSLIQIEKGASLKLSLKQVASLAEVYQVSLRDLVCGWHGEEVPAPAKQPAADALVSKIRVNIRRARHDSGHGTPWVSEQSGVEQSTLVRWESGEYDIDLIRLALVADALGADLRAWLTPEA